MAQNQGGRYIIDGGRPVSGTVRISGNKNAALPCLAATLLAREPVTLRNIPRIADVGVMVELLEILGMRVENREPGVYHISGTPSVRDLPYTLVDAVRGSILLVGPLVARCGAVRLPPPGGDVIGLRRLDTHFSVLEALGATCVLHDNGLLDVRTPSGLSGTDVFLDEASVTATENAVMAASVASGTTILRNAACEPHVQDLCSMLNQMGAKISGIGSNLLVIEGVAELHGCDFTIGYDYMEAGSFIGLAAATRGTLILEGTDGHDVPMIRNGFARLGIEWESLAGNRLVVPAEQRLSIVRTVNGGTPKLDDAPWPGFPADLLSIMTVVATQAKGNILIHEKMFESRMFFIDWLIRMGADIILCDPHRAVVTGPMALTPARLTSPDVRAGMALIIAALCAEGRSEIQNVYQVERGYEDLVGKLKILGAAIERVE
ncbi:UDP-N-acetylglucosamine 1-carboxyvinyltransferase [Parasphaerochaeta coccoides]|uniref:UDP-N-acetylglucosamine 1-carboxyvinyltransferase n=1 Tax=Parasphaerochaeta coccoides (strain ATCC BAA-1237 / DSM 17374 / SPN1) TaxID=760011 RepID=F4GIB0_PARC1|nr:UDP-N-acetylglucosamine 1-carboxyvinyltransferase [Parasphaerochaeta coccoides]AEC01269.1 UDP-N-acetylglucosamine 1-carboxyvinyltransferase [Parasphaerochaeta coccoides DSM 17374]